MGLYYHCRERGDEMVVNYDINKINCALQDFYNATGIDIDLLRTDFSPASSYRMKNNRYCQAIQCTSAGKNACFCSDAALLDKCRESKKAEMHICHGCLVNVAIPLFYGDELIGYIIFGRMKPDTELPLPDEHLSALGLDTGELRKYYHDIPLFDSDRIQSVSNVATMLAKYILLENMLKPDLSECLQSAVTFIDANLERELSVKEISKNANSSKSTLYKNFRTHFNCTVSEYIHTKRIERATELLTKTNLSIEEISQRVGFSSASYFCRIFKKQTGFVPVKYRKLHG